MQGCFMRCEKLIKVTLKCNYRDGNCFDKTFDDCWALTAGSIKVPAGQLATYQANAGVMGTTPDKFAAE